MRHLDKRVLLEQLLCRQQTRASMREVDLIVGVELVLPRAELVHAALHDRLDHPLAAEPVLDELLSELVEEGCI